MSTQPTDAEILELASQYWYSLDETESETEIELVRAALAKWGTPAPVGVEPVAYLHDDGYWTAAKNDAGRRLNDRLLFAGSPKVAVYTAPQPTQAQAGAEPLTDEQIRAMLNKHPPEDVCGWSYRMGIDDAELHHGIKGGQHVE